MKYLALSLPLSLLALVAGAQFVEADELPSTRVEQPTPVERSAPSQETERTQPIRSVDVQITPDSFPDQQAATLTCEGYLACFQTISFCDQVGGGMSSNPDGSYTCSY